MTYPTYRTIGRRIPGTAKFEEVGKIFRTNNGSVVMSEMWNLKGDEHAILTAHFAKTHGAMRGRHDPKSGIDISYWSEPAPGSEEAFQNALHCLPEPFGLLADPPVTEPQSR